MTEKGIYLTEDGSHSIYSKQFGESYHSRHGALQESQHVFIEAGYQAKKALPQINVLEMGFGTGLNAFLTYLRAFRQQIPTYYLGIEAYPIAEEEAMQFNYATLLEAGNQSDVFHQMHQCNWKEERLMAPQFTFEKRNIKIEALSIEPIFDVIYYDAFAPSAQPELWEPPILEKMYNNLRSGGTLVTYCAKGVFKRHLKAIGFKVEALPGPPGKREMTRAWKV